MAGAALVSLASTGCAAELDDQGAAYPEPIGYTTTPAQMSAQAYAPPAQIEAKPTVEIGGAGDGTADPNGDVSVGGGGGGGGDGGDYADTDPSALTDFHGALDPYGTWVDDSTYGTVWVPSASAVGSDFSPYVSAGHWAYDDDYTWVSDYSWGWAPFHYGRWTYMTGTGWGWIPGRTYAGAWVSWRTGYDDWGYVGWAPLPPTYYWRGGYAYGLGVVPYAPYAFCASGELFRPGIASHIVTGNQVGVVASHTRPFVSASPGVGGAASGRVAARPNVGPSPSSLGIAQASVVHSPADNHGLAQARAFAHPGTAASLGARPPAQSTAARSYAQNNRAASPANTRSPYASSAAGRGWRSAPPAYSYGSRGYGASPGATYRSPYSSSRGGSSYGGGYGGRSYGSTPYYGSSRSYGGAASPGGTYHASPSGGSSSQHSSESSGGGYSGGYHGGGGFRGGGGGGRGGGGHR
jgi:hypothetical protein